VYNTKHHPRELREVSTARTYPLLNRELNQKEGNYGRKSNNQSHTIQTYPWKQHDKREKDQTILEAIYGKKERDTLVLRHLEVHRGLF